MHKFQYRFYKTKTSSHSKAGGDHKMVFYLYYDVAPS